MTSNSLGNEMVSAVAWNARDVNSISVLGAICPIFITANNTGAMTRILQMVVESTPDVCV